MSGGHWDYQNDRLARDIFGWSISADYGEKGFSQAAQARRINPLEDKMMSEILWDMLCVLHSYDWYACGDNCEETYLEDVKRFKEKWLLLSDEEITKREVKNCLSEVKEDIYKSLGITFESDGERRNEE